MNMKKVTVTDEDSHGHSLLRADRITVALQRNGLYTTVFFASRPDSGRIAKKQIIHRCLLRQSGSSRIAKKRIIHLLQGGWKHPLSIMNI